ncbi:MAG: rod shape determining protein RodA [Paraglaciecola sp.]|jgi:rod shape determining protein RodA
MRGAQTSQIDWLTILLYFSLVIFGWLSIYAADFDPDVAQSLFSFQNSSGRQLIWILTSIGIMVIIFLLDYRVFESLAYLIYLGIFLLLVSVLFFGQEVAGSTSWFQIGGFKLQPSEFAKTATALALAKYLSEGNRNIKLTRDLVLSTLVFLLPMSLILLQGDAGTSMVFLSFVIVLFREGMSPGFILIGFGAVLVFLLTLLLPQTGLIIGIIVLTLLILGIAARSIKKALIIISLSIISIGMVVSVDFVLNNVLKDHQRKRVMLLINPNADPLGVGWNTTQSKIAIGSGGFTGKGFLQGTQTKFDFVPEQTTDFIFCTIGEEQGWLGSTVLLFLFGALLIRITQLAERQKSSFVRIYGYSIVSVIFFHFAINIAMTIGLFPVIGIPLPFFSYGGSSLWSFTIMLFVFLKLDSHRMEVLQRL